VPLVFEPVPRVARGRSPELRCRAAPPRRAERWRRRNLAGRAALDEFAASHASPRCNPRTKLSPLARSRAAPPPPAAARHRPLPSVVAARLRAF
jgi:hypothetical protein